MVKIQLKVAVNINEDQAQQNAYTNAITNAESLKIKRKIQK